MSEEELAAVVVDAAFHVHQKLGPGLLEGAYEAVLFHELIGKGLSVKRQHPVPLLWKGLTVEEAYRADLIVEERLLIELKALERLHPVHKKQVITYLRLADLRLGLLINFGVPLIKDGIERIVNGLKK